MQTDPLKSSTYWGKKEDRPRFAVEFWAEKGIETIHHESGGWPHLVQLLAETAVDIANDRAIHELDKSHYGQIFDESVEKGHTVFHELIVRECKSDTEVSYLEGFRNKEYQPELMIGK